MVNKKHIDMKPNFSTAEIPKDLRKSEITLKENLAKYQKNLELALNND